MALPCSTDDNGKVTSMNDMISVFNGVSPSPLQQIDWREALQQIRGGTYKKEIEHVRGLIHDLEAYRREKKRLPAVTFTGTFHGNRDKEHVLAASGFIIADFDHLENVEEVFELVCQDERVWFAFRSPSGHGIKCGLRSTSIKSDEDIKRFYAAIESYFKTVYDLETDPSCKDISRLTFLSNDPDAYIAENPISFHYESWLEKVCQPEPGPRIVYEPVVSNFTEGKRRYAMKVLESCCQEIVRSQEGNQHHTRMRMSYLVGGYLAYIDENTALSALEGAVVASGAKNIPSSMKTIRSGLAKGSKSPIVIPDLVSSETTNAFNAFNGSNDPNACNDPNDDNAEKRSLTVPNAPLTLFNASLTLPNALDQDRRPRYQGSLANDLREWLGNRTGCVTKREIWDEFGLVNPADKANLRVVLHSLLKREYIYKDRYKSDTYWVKQEDFQYDDLDEVEDTDSGLLLPLKLHELMTVPRGSVFLLEGCTNAGKTAFCFNVLRANFGGQVPLRYVYSEGSKSEITIRLASFSEFLGDDINVWKQNIKTAFFPVNHHQFVLQQNPTGLTVIDYLRPVEGDFTKIGPSIDLIAESAGNGFVMVCVQKKTGSAFGVGGQNNHFAPRNVFSLDHVVKDGGYDFCYLTIKKCKYPRDYKNNPDGKEIHFAIRGGAEIIQLSQPMYCDENQRKAAFLQYRYSMFGKNMSDGGSDVPF